MELLLTEKNGREKSYPLHKGVTRVGSAPFCDVQLPLQGIAPLQLQIFYAVQQPDRCKVINIGPEIWVNQQGSRQKLTSSSTLEMVSGDELLIDTNRLIFKLPATSGVTRTSSSIATALSFPNPVLYPDIPSVGTLTLRNTGKSASCQFQVRVSGLPGDCFRIDPAPLLYPNAEEHFLLHLFHRGRYPKAGFHEIKLIISASNTYPGDEVIIRQQIYVTPIFDAKMELQDDLPVNNLIKEKHPMASFSRADADALVPPIAAVSATTVQPVEKVRKLEQNIPEDYWAETGAK